MVDLLEDRTVGLLGGRKVGPMVGRMEVRTEGQMVDRMEVRTEKHLGIQQTQVLTEGQMADRMEVLMEKHLGIQQTQALTEGLTVDLLVARMEDPAEEQRIQQQQTERACLMEEEGALMLWPSRLELVLPLRVLQEPSPR